MAVWVFNQGDLGKFSLGNVSDPKKVLMKTNSSQERKRRMYLKFPWNWELENGRDFC